MSQPYDRCYNFSAGPCCLQVEVLEEARDTLMNYGGSGTSVMEMSHRSKPFEDILAATEADLRQLMGIPANYKVLFLQGGASLQFTMLPMCFLGDGEADYFVTGTWSGKAKESGELVGKINVLFDGKETKYDRVPKLSETRTTPGAKYILYVSNETVHGVDFFEEPPNDEPWICDMSSNILSRPVDVSRYNVIFAGAQKNMGPAGVTLVIMREDWLDKVPKNMAPMLDYRVQAKNDSMYNTPPCWSIFMCGLTYKWMLAHGGVPAAQKLSEERSKLIYEAIDSSGGFYKGHAQLANRSKMNITFTLPSEDLTAEFIREAEARKMFNLAGHRSLGGIRASIYNAFPIEGCRELTNLMAEFANKHAAATAGR